MNRSHHCPLQRFYMHVHPTVFDSMSQTPTLTLDELANNH
jgi:hypothetical protein